MVAKLYHLIYILQNPAVTVIGDFNKACEVLGGEVQESSVGHTCVIKPHNKATIKIETINSHLKSISAENEGASTYIDFPFPGEKVAKVSYNEHKRLAVFTLAGGGTCSFTRLPRIVRGVCIIGGRTVEFSFDP